MPLGGNSFSQGRSAAQRPPQQRQPAPPPTPPAPGRQGSAAPSMGAKKPPRKPITGYGNLMNPLLPSQQAAQQAQALGGTRQISAHEAWKQGSGDQRRALDQLWMSSWQQQTGITPAGARKRLLQNRY